MAARQITRATQIPGFTLAADWPDSERPVKPDLVLWNDEGMGLAVELVATNPNVFSKTAGLNATFGAAPRARCTGAIYNLLARPTGSRCGRTFLPRVRCDRP